MVRWLYPVLLLFAFLLSACSEEEAREIPPPEKISHEAIGHYCGMAVMNHEGPKGQILLKDRDSAVWFTSVRDLVAYTKLFDSPKQYSAIYVTDMGKASEWEHPENDGPWVEARDALFVVGSSRIGSMGAPETVPFSDRGEADSFVKKYGGRVLKLSDIPQDAVLGGVDLKPVEGGHKP